MSTILRALKKLEYSPLERKVFRPLHLEIDVKKTVGRGSQGRRLHFGIIFILLGIPLLLTGGWLLHKYVATPVQNHLHNQPVSNTLQLETKKNPGPDKAIPPKTVKTASEARQKLNKPIAPLDSKNPEAVLVKPLSRIRKNLPVSVQEKQSDSLPVQSRAAKNVEPSLPTTVVDASGFTLQAIVWSRVSADRLSVINNQIVREGDFISGMMITKIDLDEVSLAAGGKVLKLKIRSVN